MNLKSQFINSLFLKFIIGIVLFTPYSCEARKLKQEYTESTETSEEILLGIDLTQKYLPLIRGKKVGLVSNHTSVVNQIHLVDTLLALEIDIVKVFSPEHGFRGDADAGEMVGHQVDRRTGLPIVSLYGKNKKPSAEQLKGIEILVFDMQDVGARFYTYISTLHYVMEAAAELDIPLLVLDRPNPNGNYIDGPILEKKFESFVGMHPIPIVHGMTIGEYAQMINGENWLKGKVQCKLRVIACENYNHQMEYQIPISPSPNLPNMASIYNYPSICFFEGTKVSLGRGTDKPFQQIGHPELKNYSFSFTPKPSFGSKNPKLNGETCLGLDLSFEKRVKQLDLNYLLDFYNQFPKKDQFFTDYFNLLSGNASLKNQIIAGKTAKEIRASWASGLATFKIIRKKYLLYPDFE